MLLESTVLGSNVDSNVSQLCDLGLVSQLLCASAFPSGKWISTTVSCRVVMKLHNWHTISLRLTVVITMSSPGHISSILKCPCPPHTHFNIFYSQWTLILPLILWVVICVW